MPDKNKDENEIVTVAMWPDNRLRLYGQVTARMEKLGHNPCDYKQLGLGFELPADWPYAEESQPTLAQLIVVAVKLNMKIVIHDLGLEPMVTDVQGKES